MGSPSPEDALLVQLDVLSENYEVPNHSREMIKNGMELLSRRAYNELGRLLQISAQEAKTIANFITENLNPYPARAHWGSYRQGREAPHGYQTPDIIIKRLYEYDDSPLIVEILSPYSGLLRVNPLFKKALSQAPSDKIRQWKSDVEQATLLVKCIQQRNNTMVRLMQKLVTFQRDFILNGDAYIHPITRASVADELGVHESTISRAVASKAVQLPNRRIIPLAKMFDRSLHIRTALREIIELETKPLSDTQISKALSKKGFTVARRTVAKYRAMEGILPARLRNLEPIPN